MKFITLEEIVLIHEVMIAVGGGRSSTHDFTLLHSAIERPKAQFGGNYLYTSVWLMAAALLQSLVKNHPFDDGNKRTAYAATSFFLSQNGYILKPDQEDTIAFMVCVDTKNTAIEQIAQWLKRNTK